MSSAVFSRSLDALFFFDILWCFCSLFFGVFCVDCFCVRMILFFGIFW